MVEHRSEFERAIDTDEDADDSFDFEQIKEWGGFILRAARRRPKLVVTLFVVVSALGVTLGKTLPATYNSQVKLLAQRSTVLRTLSGSKGDLNQTDNPTKNAGDMILRRDNIVALVKESDLVDRFEATRNPLLRLRDTLMAKLFGEPSDDDRLHALVGMLESKLAVTVDDANVTISVDWPNPRMAYELVTLV